MTAHRDPIDIYLLRVLHTLLLEGSVTRTAVKLAQSQPAVSAALKRLRDITGDPLLVRGKSGMVPTEYGTALLEPVSNALHEINRIATRQIEFDPAKTMRIFRIGSSDYLNIFYVPGLVANFCSAAPNAKLELHSLAQDSNYEAALEDGRFDIVIGNWPEPPQHLQRRTLFNDRVVCLVGQHHPHARTGLTEAAYLQGRHLVSTPYSSVQLGPIESHLMRVRLKRDVAVMVPYFSLAPALLTRTELIFTTTDRFARYYARSLPLTVLESPIDFPPMQYYAMWHPRMQHSEALRWLVDGIVAAVSGKMS